MTLQIVRIALLAGLLSAAVWTDLRHRRIPNRLVVVVLLTGLALNAGVLRWLGLAPPDSAGIGLGTALAGGLAGLAIVLPLYALGGVGAGDAKLVAAIGAWLGPVQIAGAVLLAAIAGAMLALVRIAWSRLRPSVFADPRATLFSLMTGTSDAAAPYAQICRGTRLPYALAIACGTALQLAFASHAGWVLR